MAAEGQTEFHIKPLAHPVGRYGETCSSERGVTIEAKTLGRAPARVLDEPSAQPLELVLEVRDLLLELAA